MIGPGSDNIISDFFYNKDPEQKTDFNYPVHASQDCHHQQGQPGYETILLILVILTMAARYGFGSHLYCSPIRELEAPPSPSPSIVYV